MLLFWAAYLRFWRSVECLAPGTLTLLCVLLAWFLPLSVFCISFSSVSATELQKNERSPERGGIKLYLLLFSLICFGKVYSSKETTWAGVCCKYLMWLISDRAASDLIRRIKTSKKKKKMSCNVSLTVIQCTHDPGPHSPSPTFTAYKSCTFTMRWVCGVWSACTLSAVQLTGEDGSSLTGAGTLTPEAVTIRNSLSEKK